MANCIVCNSQIVEPYGSGDILLVGDSPSYLEMEKGYPFVDDSGEILRNELLRVGIDLWSGCRLTLMWRHDPTKNQDCFAWMMRDLALEMAGRKVLLLGSDITKQLLNKGIADISGTVVTSPLFPKSAKFVMAVPNPGICKNKPHGEFRLAIQKFAKLCKEVQ